MVDYWSLTGDSTYNSLVSSALLAQIGSSDNYMPANQSASEGNDDQSIWALAALTAAERGFTAGTPSWLELATNVFDTQAARWDQSTCDGGLRWMIAPFNNGYNYKNSLANGNFFQLAARLAHLTNNQTYADWAEKSYSWLVSSGFIDSAGSVYDGADTTANCSDINAIQFTATSGVVLYGSAVMYNYTKGGSTWSDRLNTLTSRATSVFFTKGVATEISCEPQNACDTDMHFYKGMFMRDLARAAQAAPYTADTILPLLKSSGEAVASAACTNANGSCVFSWTGDKNATVQDLGSQYSALQAIQANLVQASGSSAATTTSSNGTASPSGGSSAGGQPSGSSTPKNAGGSLKDGLATWLGYAGLFLIVELFVTDRLF